MTQPCPNCVYGDTEKCVVCYGTGKITKPEWHNATHEQLFQSLIPGWNQKQAYAGANKQAKSTVAVDAGGRQANERKREAE